MMGHLSSHNNGASFLVKYFVVVVILFGCMSLLLSVRFPEIHSTEARMLKDGLGHFVEESFKLKHGVGESIHDPEHGSSLAGLNCGKWGGPTQEQAQEMVYWKDIPSDAQFVSHFHDFNGPTQYMSFEIDHAGFNNVRMAMETLMATALTMGRTLVLPPAQEIQMLSSSDEEQNNEFSFDHFFPMKQISDEHVGFSIITMEEYLNLFLDGRFKHPKTGETLFPPNNRTKWNGAEDDELDVLQKWLRESSRILRWNPEKCIATFPRSSGPNDMKEIEDIYKELAKEGYPSFKEFVGKPVPVDAGPKERIRESSAEREGHCVYNDKLQQAPWIHFPVLHDKKEKSRMLVHFYAFLFFADWKTDLWTKRFVRDHIRYTDEIQCAAARIVTAIRQHVYKRTGGKSNEFDTLHVRRGDFSDYFDVTQSTAEDIYEMTSKNGVVPENATIYIGTDEGNKTFFNLLKERYDVLFLDDFEEELGDINTNFYGMIDQLVASRGSNFFGCWFSTFSGYIHRLRGYHANNKKVAGYEQGIVPTSFYYALKQHYGKMQEYHPVKKSFYAREFPTSWRLIDTGVADS